MSYMGEATSGSIPYMTTNTTFGTIPIGVDSQMLRMAAGAPAWGRPKVVMVSGNTNVNISTVESGIISGVITPSSTSSIILVHARIDMTKDAGTVARVATITARRGPGTTSPQLSMPCVVRAQPLASTQFGPAVISFWDIPNTTSPVNYVIRGLTDTPTVTTTNKELWIMEL